MHWGTFPLSDEPLGEPPERLQRAWTDAGHAPERLWSSLERVGVPESEIDMITWKNACDFYDFRPFEHRTRAEGTVGALRRQSPDVDTAPKSFGKRASVVPMAGSLG